MSSRLRPLLLGLATAIIALAVGSPTLLWAQRAILFSEDFEGVPLGFNIDEGLYIGGVPISPEPAVYSPDGPPGWSVDRTGVPGYGTAEDGITEFAGWSFLDSRWWLKAGDQGREGFAEYYPDNRVIAVADGDAWSDSPRPGETMETFLTTPEIPVTPGPQTLHFLTSWRPDPGQIATITASFGGGNAVEIMRWNSDIESDSFQAGVYDPPEYVSVGFDAPSGSHGVRFNFGYIGGDNQWWAVDDVTFNDFFENFESLNLGPNVDEQVPRPQEHVWTPDLPTGWTVANDIPGQDLATDQNGVSEWIGWTLVDKDFWSDADAEDERRSEFVNGIGAIAVADSGEWSDEPNPGGNYNTWLTTPAIPLGEIDPDSIQIQFDSSWRPRGNQTATIQASFDGNEQLEILRWESVEESAFYMDDMATNGTITFDVPNPGGAESLVLTFAYTNATDGWWWAIDNLTVTGTSNTAVTGDFNANGILDAGDLDLHAFIVAWGENIPLYDLNSDGVLNFADREQWVNALKNTWIGDANLDGQFNSSDFVVVFTAGKYETGAEAGWSEGDWDGDLQFGSSDFVTAFVGGGYEAGPRMVRVTVPEPSGVIVLFLGAVVLLHWRVRYRDACCAPGRFR